MERWVSLQNRLRDEVWDRAAGVSRGGMASKLEAARQATVAGENVIIAGGRNSDVLERIIAGDPVGTLLLARGQTIAARKRWIGLTVQPRGRLLTDAGARDSGRTASVPGQDVPGHGHRNYGTG